MARIWATPRKDYLQIIHKPQVHPIPARFFAHPFLELLSRTVSHLWPRSSGRLAYPGPVVPPSHDQPPKYPPPALVADPALLGPRRWRDALDGSRGLCGAWPGSHPVPTVRRPQAHSVVVVAPVFAFGIFIWTAVSVLVPHALPRRFTVRPAHPPPKVEYVLHRWVFHLDEKVPDHPLGVTIHFLLHGVHHMLPMDRYRLVFPPSMGLPVGLILFAVLRIPFFRLPLPLYCGLFAGRACGALRRPRPPSLSRRACSLPPQCSPATSRTTCSTTFRTTGTARATLTWVS